MTEPSRMKPSELLDLYEEAAHLFETIQEEFRVPRNYEISLKDVDAGPKRGGDPIALAALTMLRVQSLRLAATPGVEIPTAVVVCIAVDLTLALETLAAAARSTEHAYSMRRAREKINNVGHIVAALDRPGERPPISLL